MKKLLVITLILSAFTAAGRDNPVNPKTYGIKMIKVTKRMKCKNCVVFKPCKYVYKPKRNRRVK